MATQDMRPNRSAGRRPPRSQGSLFDDEVDLAAVRESLGLEGYYRVVGEVREGMLRRSQMYRELPLDVFDRAAERAIEERLVLIGRQRGLFVGARARPIDFR